MKKYRVILKGTGAIFGEFETRVQAANGRSQNHKNCERLRANLRAITCNELLFNGFTLANVWRLG